MKSKRHAVILELVEKYSIDTQEELLRLLKLEGFDVTQATVSRDINELQLIKTLTADGTYRYSLSVSGVQQELKSKFSSILSDCVVSVDFALNTAVVKCHNGMAQAACAAIDGLKFDSVVGTIAGDDTIFILFKSEKKASTFSSKLIEFIKK